MRRPFSSWTSFGVLLSLCASCFAPAEGSGTTENAGESTANGESSPETNGETAETTSDSGQTTTGSTTTNTTAGTTTTSPGTTSTTTSPGTTETSEGTTSTGGETETTTTDTTETGQDPYRGCDGEPLPDVILTPVIEGLSSPIAIEFIEGDPGYAYVALRAGPLLRVNMADPANGREELLNVNAAGGAMFDECGFLSFAFHPGYDGASEQRLYVSYNPACGMSGQSVVAEYTLSGATATFVRDIVTVDQPASNHNGGHVTFGPDGYLYFGLGDGGGGNDQYGNGQNPATALGSILRLDVDNLDTPPAGNLTSASIDGGEVDPRILHWGLRNPWRFSFDRVTDDLYIADVGQVNWEEVSVLSAGSGPTNFGWPAFEGQVACPMCSNPELYPGVTDLKPVMVYPAPNPGQGGASITGGFVYRGAAIPDLYGRYVYADYRLDWIRAFTWDGANGVCDEGELVTRQRSGMVSFSEDLAGELYVVHMTDGTVYRIDPA